MKFSGYAAILAGLVIAGAASAGPNLIVNGDFSAGYTGFDTQYDFIASPGPDSLVPEGTITIAANPNSVHPSWVSLGSSNNPMLIVNGATTSPSPTIWEEDNLAVDAGKTYTFSATVMDICCNASYGSNANAPSEIEFQVSTDGGANWTDLASYMTQPGTVAQSGDSGVAVSIYGSVHAALAGQLAIRAINGLTAAGGNDFALDNISLSTPEPATWALMLVGMGALGSALRARRGAIPA
jgi:hypothetical protein